MGMQGVSGISHRWSSCSWHFCTDLFVSPVEGSIANQIRYFFAKYHTWITNGTVQSSSFRAPAIEPINHKRNPVVGRLVTNKPPSRPRW
jgi:hypothetical protein